MKLLRTIRSLLYLAKEYEQKQEMKQRLEDEERLKLCAKHNPIEGLTNYAEHNCDYCKLLKRLEQTNEVTD